jgi:hypothetical protein
MICDTSYILNSFLTSRCRTWTDITFSQQAQWNRSDWPSTQTMLKLRAMSPTEGSASTMCSNPARITLKYESVMCHVNSGSTAQFWALDPSMKLSVSFHRSRIVCRTPWMGDQLAARPLHVCPGVLWGWRSWWNERFRQGKPKYSEKTCRKATLSTTNPTCQTRARTQAATVGSQWLTASAMAQPHVKSYCAVTNHALALFWLQFKYQFNSIRRKGYSVEQRFTYQCTRLQTIRLNKHNIQ